MDTVPRRRQGAVSGEPDLEEAANELAYSAALSQADGKATNLETMPRREAAPGTFESGKGSGKSYEPEQMPTTNPFHSERVKSEVQLLRSRPLTLDEDGKRLCGDVDEQALGDPSWDGGVKEPDYGSAFSSAAGPHEAPRVARI